MSLRKIPVGAALTLLLSFVSVGYAADHGDGPVAVADPAADIADLLVWMSPDAERVNLVMTVGRGAILFSDQIQYIFHVTSKAAFFEPSGFDTEVLCEFAAAQQISCFIGDEYVTGNAGSTSGLRSSSGRLRVFAGLRNDPFFFNSSGFRATTAAVAAAASSLTFDPAGCPALDVATATALVTQLSTEPGGGTAIDNFGNQNILAIVLEVDRALLTQGGPIVGVWASTRRR